jgi:hypothetical protein
VAAAGLRIQSGMSQNAVWTGLSAAKQESGKDSQLTS